MKFKKENDSKISDDLWELIISPLSVCQNLLKASPNDYLEQDTIRRKPKVMSQFAFIPNKINTISTITAFPSNILPLPESPDYARDVPRQLVRILEQCKSVMF